MTTPVQPTAPDAPPASALLFGRRTVALLALATAAIVAIWLWLTPPGILGKADALALTQLPALRVVGLMTHFPVEDAADVRRVLATYLAQTEWLIGAAKLVHANAGTPKRSAPAHKDGRSRRNC